MHKARSEASRDAQAHLVRYATDRKVGLLAAALPAAYSNVTYAAVVVQVHPARLAAGALPTCRWNERVSFVARAGATVSGQVRVLQLWMRRVDPVR